MPEDVTPCIDATGRCLSYHSGHLMHFIHAKHIGRTPWGWRDAVVARYDEDTRVVVVRYVDEGGIECRLWHHAVIPGLDQGLPVRVHERYHALGSPSGWRNCAIVRGGLGPVPEPLEPALWADQTTAGIVDLSTGVALPLDHLTPVDEESDQ